MNKVDINGQKISWRHPNLHIFSPIVYIFSPTFEYSSRRYRFGCVSGQLFIELLDRQTNSFQVQFKARINADETL